MICRKCNNQIVDTARFCPFCGEPAAKAPAPAPENADQARDTAAQAAAGQPAQAAAGQSAQPAARQAEAPQPRGAMPAQSAQPARAGTASISEQAMLDRMAAQAEADSMAMEAGLDFSPEPETDFPQAAAQRGAGTSGGTRVKPVYVLAGAVVLFLLSFFAAVLFTRVLPGRSASGSSAAASEGTRSAGSAASDAGSAGNGWTADGEAGEAVSSGAAEAESAAAAVSGDAASSGSTGLEQTDDDSYADDAAALEAGSSGVTSSDGTAGDPYADESYADDAARDAEAEAVAAETSPIPVLRVDRTHIEGANGYCEEDYDLLGLGDGTDVIFPGLSEALADFGIRRAGEIEAEYSDLVTYAEDTQRTLSTGMSISLARADERLVSLICGFSDYSGGAHGYYYNFGAAFDVQTGEQLALTDLCTDIGRLASIIAADLYAEDAARFTSGEDALRQTILESYLESADSSCWAVMPEGIMFYFPPYGISFYAAGQPYTMVKFADYPEIFDSYYCTAQSDYVIYLPNRGGAGAKIDLDGDGSMDEISFYFYSKEVDSVYYYQDIHLYLNEVEYTESTPVFRDANYALARVGGRTFFLVSTDNLDDTASTYVFDLTGGTAVCTDVENESIFDGSAAHTDYGTATALQSVRPDRILLGGDGAEAYALTADGMLEPVS